MPSLTTAFAQGLAAGRPAAATSNAGFMYFSTDSGVLAQSTGSAWVALGFASPLTTQDDLIVGGAAGAPARLGKGTDGQVLTVDPTTHHLVWATPASGFSDPTTTKGDLIVHGTTTSRLGVGTDTQVLTADSTQTLGVTWAAPASGALSKISQVTVGFGGAASIAFGSIAGTYAHLRLVVVARDSSGNTADGLMIQFNGDTAANYDYQWFTGNGASVNIGNSASQTSGAIGVATGGAAPASVFAQTDAMIAEYTSTSVFKNVHASVLEEGSNGINAGSRGARWKSTAAITSILLFPASGNFVQGSVASLYGLS